MIKRASDIHAIKKIDQDEIMMRQAFRHDRLRERGATEGELDWLVQELGGGPCRVCKKPWAKVHVVNRYADFEYYTPECDCYQRCRECGMSLYGLVPPRMHTDKYVCPRCGTKGEEKWRLTCSVCGQVGEWHIGKPYRYVCGECKKRSSKSRRDALSI